MSDEATLLGMETLMLSPGWDRETIIVDSGDDVEAHGMRTFAGIAASVAVIAGSAGSAFLAQAGTALAPEPATLTSDMNAYETSAWAVYTSTNVNTTGHRYNNSWKYDPNGLPAGAPCSSAQISETLVVGMQLTQVIEAKGNYRRCI